MSSGGEQGRVQRTPRMERLLAPLLLCIITQVSGHPCDAPCQCAEAVARCPAGVPLVLDGCRCCWVCAGREGEACTERLPCDRRSGLQCDYSASYPGGPGECVGQNELGCELGGVRLEEGQTFKPSCDRLCRCLGGGVTCVPLCTDDLRSPASAASCRGARLVRLAGRCCKEWVCDDPDNSIYPEPATVEKTAERALGDERHFGGGPPGHALGLISNCAERDTDWSPCSRSCGPGVSKRTSSSDRACRLQTQTRLCQVRPCQTPLPHGLQTQGAGLCESSYISPVSVWVEHQGCWSTRAFRPRFCKTVCPEGHCCGPQRTRTVPMAFRCPQGILTQQRVMMIESCSCGNRNCPRPQAPKFPWRALT